MMGSWFRDRRRRRLLARPFPGGWLDTLEGLEMYGRLAADRKARLRDLLRVLAAKKHWEGCGGLEVTDEMRVVISAQACLLILELSHEYYRRVDTILVYPSAYRHRGHSGASVEVVEEWSANAGESWSGGPIVLSWDDVVRGARDPHDGRNLVYHEFAHALDCLDGWADGIPPVGSKEQREAWQRVVGREYGELRDRAERGQPTFLDPYGATNPAEFFAVATECFFERPRELRRHLGSLYELLATFYRQDPMG